MPESQNKKRDYTLISSQLVQNQNYPIKVAAQLLKLKLSTAKLIVKKHRDSLKEHETPPKTTPEKPKHKNPQKTQQNPFSKESHQIKTSSQIEGSFPQNPINLIPSFEQMQQMINWIWINHYYPNMGIYHL